MTIESPPTPRETWRSLLLTRHRGQPKPIKVGRFLRVLGPGLITGAADDDPSGIGTYSQAGAAFGSAQLWLALYLVPLTIAVQEMCGRIGLVTGQGIAGVLRKHYSRRILLGAVVLLFSANTINVGADLGAMAASVRLLMPEVPFVPLLVVIALAVLGLEVFVPYKQYARVLKVLTLSLLAYIVTGIIIQPNWGKLLLATIVPQIELTPAFFALMVALLGTTISPYLFFWQASEEVEEQEEHHRQARNIDEKRQRIALHKQLHGLHFDTVLGMFAANITFWFIVMTTGNTLHTHGITNIASAQQAAEALKPLVHGFPDAGALARLIFALGILGTGLLAVPVLAGSSAYGIAEALGWRKGLSQPFNHARGFYCVIALGTLIGLALNLIGVNAVAALVYSAILNGIVAVPLLVLILLVANNKKILGEHTNGRLSNVVGIIAATLMSVAAVVTVATLFGFGG